MSWRWFERRRLTIGFVVFFAGWYLVQLSVLSTLGAETAIWWFYFEGPLSPGYLFAPISHNMAALGHLGANIGFLLIFGGLAEPYLDRRRYIVVLVGLSFGGILVANLLSMAVGTQWVRAGASGGILGLWAYISVKHRDLCCNPLDPVDSQHSAEVVLVASGLLAPLLVPGWELYTLGAANVSHAVGLLLGYGFALVEAPPQVEQLNER